MYIDLETWLIDCILIWKRGCMGNRPSIKILLDGYCLLFEEYLQEKLIDQFLYPETLPKNRPKFRRKSTKRFFFSYDVTNHANLGRGDVTHDARRPSASVDNILTCIILHILLYLIQ